jgi:rhodanese-related sulfurtransferase
MIARHSSALMLALALALPPATAFAGGQMSLIELERKVAQDYRGVAHVLPEQLEAQMQAPANLLLLDARAADEIAVSRLPGAIAVDPDMSAADFAQRFGAVAKDRDIIIYCSVGVRSSKLATRVREAMMAKGARRVANLQGGIFAMHNTGRGLVDRLGHTDLVHPYSWWWSGYIDFDNLARYEPRPAAAPLPDRGSNP